MKRSALRLLLVCLMICGILAACDSDDAPEMTAVILDPVETVASTEQSEATAATEEKRTLPTQQQDASVEAPTEPNAETRQLSELTQPPSTESMPTETEAESQSLDELRSYARLCVNAEVSILYGLIGYPPYGSSYQDVHLGDTPDGRVVGQIGTLYYDGFTVYTYRDGSMEIVTGVS